MRIFPLILTVILCSLSFGQNSAPTYEEFCRRVWCADQMSANANRTTYGMAPLVATRGYVRGYRPEVVQPLINRGVERFLWHLPYGNSSAFTNPRGPMNFTERLVAQRNGFVGPLDFGQMLQEIRRDEPDVVTIAYLGTPRHPDLQRRLARPSTWRDAVHRSLVDVDNAANTDVALDATSPCVEGSPEQALVDEEASLKATQGREVYIESAPLAGPEYEWSHDENVICDHRFWLRSRPPNDVLGGFSDSAWAQPSQGLSGRIILWDVVSGYGSDYPVIIAAALRTGPRYEWAGNLVYWFKEPGPDGRWSDRTMEDLYAAVVEAWEPVPNEAEDASTPLLDDAYEVEYREELERLGILSPRE